MSAWVSTTILRYPSRVRVATTRSCSVSRPPPSYHCQTITSQGYVYIRNARFFETDEETGDKLFNKGTGEETAAGSGVTGQKVRAPPVDLPGLSLVAGHALTAPDEGALAVIFFFATWCANCKRCLPAILALAERYTQEGGAQRQGKV